MYTFDFTARLEGRVVTFHTEVPVDVSCPDWVAGARWGDYLESEGLRFKVLYFECDTNYDSDKSSKVLF